MDERILAQIHPLKLAPHGGNEHRVQYGEPPPAKNPLRGLVDNDKVESARG